MASRNVTEANMADRQVEPRFANITVEDFAEATFRSVLRALEARERPFGPIIYGIIAWPEGFAGETIGPGSIREQEARG
jgi:hypothetical protein